MNATMPVIPMDRCGSLYVPKLRWMATRDEARVVEIEQLCFPCPWTFDNFFFFLNKPGVEGVVAEIRGDVAAYCVYNRRKRTRPEIMNLAVAPHIRRRGLGRLLVRHVQNCPGCRSISALVSEQNVEGQLFFRSLRFRANEIVRGRCEEVEQEYCFVWKEKGHG